ncbi:MAG TPA: tail fiber domain-containing protein [Pyrinomonadaceae bacterium]
MRNKLFLAFISLLIFINAAQAQTPTFTYQGKLSDNSMPATGSYQMQFSLFATLSGGTPIGNETITNNSVAVSGGIFTVELTFTDPAAFDGSERWLEIAVKRPADPGFTTLTPRQKLNSAPYAIKSLNAGNSVQLGGVAANQYVQTSDSRLSDDRNPLPNSGNYIQNTTSQQSANFNVSGNGTANGTLSGNIVNAGTQFNISGLRMLSIAGTRNLFAGDGTGPSNTGVDNVFVGSSAGFSNAAGSGNTFVGRAAGFGVIGGSDNSFFGSLAGVGGGSGTGSLNSFFGFRSGGATTTGIQNSFFGANSGQTNISGSFNSFFGMDAGFNNKSGANSFFGWEAGSANTNGFSNSFFGSGAGQSNTLAARNSFFGDSAGITNTTGDLNSFFGSIAGQNNSAGTSNSFFGEASGQNSGGSFNTFIGQNAGLTNSTGNNNTLLGRSANVTTGSLSYATAIGSDATVGTSNTVALGRSTGLDTVQIPGALNVSGALSASGANLTNLNAGNIATGLLPLARGGTGLSSSGAAGNFLRSDGSNWTSSLLQATDIPAGSGNYIQNTTTPQAANFNVTGDGTAAGTLNGNVVNANTQYNIAGARAFILYDPTGLGATDTFAGSLAGIQNQNGRFNSFFGCGAGQSNTGGTGNSYFGCGAGGNNQSGGENTYVGRSAGFSDVGGSRNSFFGSFSGNGLGSTASDVSLFGYRAGNANTASGNIFIGSFAGEVNSSGDENTFVGFESGKANTTLFRNTFLGYRAGKAAASRDNTFLGAEAGQVSTVGAANTFVGSSAGGGNVNGAGNVFVGNVAGFGLGGQGNVSGGDNTAIGAEANVGATNLNNASAIGAQAYVTQSNSLVLGGISGVNGGTDVNVGIGTTAPATRLHVSGAGIVRVRVNSDSNAGVALALNDQPKWSVATTTGGNFQIFNDAIGQNAVFIDAATNFVGINFLAPGGVALCRNASNQISNCSSSIRYKTNVAALHSGLSLINKLRPVTFDWKQDGAHDLGLVAEDVAEMEPLLVTHNDKGQIEGVKYDRIAVVLINAVKEQQHQIDRQQKLIGEQQQQIQALKQLVCATNPASQICRAN